MPNLKETEFPNIPVAEAIRKGLARPSRRIRGKEIPPTPIGMGVFAKWEISIKDGKTGRIVPFRSPKTGRMVRKLEGPSHSFTRNFGQFIRGFLQNTDAARNVNETLTDDTGASFVCRLKGQQAIIGAAIACVTALAKIKFGNSSAPLSTTQFNLQGILLGPTTEASVTVGLTVEDSVQTIFTASGQITNGTGSSFTVEEMGLFSELGRLDGTANMTTMMLRDLTGSVIVAAGQIITGTWTFTIAV